MISMFPEPKDFTEYKLRFLFERERTLYTPFFEAKLSKYLIIDALDVGIFLLENRYVMFFYSNYDISYFSRIHGVSYETMKQNFLSNFRTKIFNTLNTSVERSIVRSLSNDCLICLDKCGKRNSFKLECNCVYSCHKKCLYDWLKVNNKCPLCSV